MKKTISKLIAMAMAVMLLSSMLLSVSAMDSVESCMSPDAGDHDLAEFSAKDKVGIFALKAAKGTKVYVFTAFLVQKGVDKYILTNEAAAALAVDGYNLTLMATDGTNIPAACIAVQDDMDIAYLEANGVEIYEALQFTNDPITTNLAAGLAYCNDEQTKCMRIEYKGFDFSKWTQIEEFRFAYEGQESALNWLGAPIFHNSTDYIVQGIATSHQIGNKSVIAVISFNGLYLEPALSLGGDRSSLSGENPDETVPTSVEPVPQPEPEPVPAKDDSMYWILGGIAVAAVAYYFYNKKQKEEEQARKAAEAKAAAAAAAAAAVNDGATIPAGPIDLGPSRGVTKAVSNWQLRAVGGPLNGKTYNISGTMKIGRSSKADIKFPDETAGISGAHCEISVSGDRVVLKDVGSTYGTFVNGSRLAPHTDKHLHASDTFALSQGGPSFRVERIGGAGGQQSGPAVRDMKNRNYQAGASGKLTFGRASGNTVVITSEDKSISSNHCVLYREGGKLYLKDLGSTNGTFFTEKERLKPNTAYHVRKGQAFFLCSPKYTFVVSEE